MTTNPRFLFRVVVGVVSLAVLFAYPASGLWWPLYVLSGVLDFPPKPERESTEDVSTKALTLGFIAAAFFLTLLLIPGSFWSGLDNRIPIPDWARGKTPPGEWAVPFWVRVVLAVFWSVVTYRRYKQLENTDAEVAV